MDYSREPIKIYTLDNKPKGTDFLEFQPGKFNWKFWDKRSIYIREDIFEYIESVFYKNLKSYDRYENTELTKEDVDTLIRALEIFAKELINKTTADSIIAHLGYDPSRMDKDYKNNYVKEKKDVVKFCIDLSAWLKQAINETGTITIIGI